MRWAKPVGRGGGLRLRTRARAWCGAVALCLATALAAGCEDTRLPDLTVAAGDRTRLGIDTEHRNYTFGLHVTDPLQQRTP
jgi:hypothetical protein